MGKAPSQEVGMNMMDLCFLQRLSFEAIDCVGVRCLREFLLDGWARQSGRMPRRAASLRMEWNTVPREERCFTKRGI